MTNALTAAAAGFGTGLSLIVAIGAQNAFVLRQGIRRDAVLAVVGICALSDALLIALGVGGVGAVVVAWPGALTAIGWIGGAFLLCYGALAARRVFRPSGVLRADGDAAGSRRRAVLTCLALTWLNPHVYLDTVLLLGSVAGTHGDPGRWWFALGACVASLLWFAGLGYGARLAAPRLARPRAWQVLDVLVGLVMLAIAVRLALGG